MRFDLDDEQRAIQETARDICRRHQALTPGPATGDALWSELASTGWTGIAVPREFGGQGLGMVELALVVEELGYALAPGTFMSNAAAASVLGASVPDALRERWLPDMAAGKLRGAIAMTRGESALALDLEGAAVLVAAGSGAVHVAEPVPHLQSHETLDVTRHFATADLSDAQRLPGDAAAALDRVEILVAADLVGVAQHAMDLAVDHAKQRQQFGRPIGAYQAVSHRCADMLVAVESARATVLSAAWTADRDPGALAFAASVAKVTAADAAWQVTTSSLQVHGGMGFTWEHPIHRFLRRAAMSMRLFRSTEEHLDRLATVGGLALLSD